MSCSTPSSSTMVARVLCAFWPDSIVQFDAVELASPDDRFLLLGGKCIHRSSRCTYFCTTT
jgi:hypothetical protein